MFWWCLVSLDHIAQNIYAVHNVVECVFCTFSCAGQRLRHLLTHTVLPSCLLCISEDVWDVSGLETCTLNPYALQKYICVIILYTFTHDSHLQVNINSEFAVPHLPFPQMLEFLLRKWMYHMFMNSNALFAKEFQSKKFVFCSAGRLLMVLVGNHISGLTTTSTIYRQTCILSAIIMIKLFFR